MHSVVCVYGVAGVCAVCVVQAWCGACTLCVRGMVGVVCVQCVHLQRRTFGRAPITGLAELACVMGLEWKEGRKGVPFHCTHFSVLRIFITGSCTDVLI